MPFENGEYWDQVSAYRLLNGLLTTANQYAKTYAGAYYFDLNLKKENLIIFLNCEWEKVQEYLETEVKPDYFEIGGAQNLVDFLVPYFNFEADI